jgi:tetratricopeptide (TPR) repeat protein/thiol-disulfide isomerase/thioredoxin
VSHSPRDSNDDAAVLRYGRAWLALNTLLRQGMSFSGRERNRCFLNLGAGTFANVSYTSGLDYLDDGRAVAAVDWDWDGDLDLWTTNGTAPRIRYLSNDGPSDHHFIALRLQGTTANRDAIGARVELYVADEEHPRRIKSLRAGDAYLSQSTKWIHFGLGGVPRVESAVVRWPGGEAETFTGLEADRYWTIVQGSGRAVAHERPRLWLSQGPGAAADEDLQHDEGARSALASDSLTAQASRVVLLDPLPLPELSYHTLDRPDAPTPLPRGRPLLIGLWATWCPPCIDELGQWTRHYDALAAAGVNLLALCVDQPRDSEAPQDQLDFSELSRLVQRLELPFAVGVPGERLIDILDIAQRTFTPAQRPLVLPCSFLFDAQGRLAMTYKGPVATDRVIADSRLLRASRDERLAGAVPFAGRWLERPVSLPPRKLALALYEAGQSEAAAEYVGRLIADHEGDVLGGSELVHLYRIQAAMLTDAKSTEQAAAALRNVLRFAPQDARAHLELGNLALRQGDLSAAERHLTAAMAAEPKDASVHKAAAALRLRQNRTDEAVALLRTALAVHEDPEAHFALANGLLAAEQPREAIEHFETALRLRPGWPAATNNLAWVLATHPDASLRDAERAVALAEQACRATRQAVPEILLTYGAALAASARFDEAIAAAESAAAIAERRNARSLLVRAQSQLDRYRQRQPLTVDGNGR